MTDLIRLAALGGSGVATPNLIGALLQSAGRPPLHVALIGRSADKLETVGAVCRDMAAQAAPPITVSTHTDPRAGLDGADGGLAGREHLRDGVHAHRVRVDEAVEAQLAAQQAGDDRSAQRGRRLGRRVERGHLDVRDHPGVGAGGDAGGAR